jgi:subtilisin family serine protease
MRRLLPLAAVVALHATPAAAPAAQPSTTGNLLVSLHAGAAARPAEIAASAGARPGLAVPQIGLVTVRPRPGTSARALARRLRRDPRVAAVEADTRGRPRFIPDDPALRVAETAPGTAPGTPVQWWATRSGFDRAWSLARGNGATVAVIDTGVEATHPDLIQRVKGARSYDRVRPNPRIDEFGHGTHVASLACATGDNGIGLAGAGMACDLLAVKTNFSDKSVAAAIAWATDRGADVINLSFGNDPGYEASLPVRRAVDYAIDRDVVLVAAAADQPIEEQGHPANLLQPTGTGPDIAAGRGLTVTAAIADGTRLALAGSGTQISMAAYGSYENIIGPPGIFGAFTAAENQLERGLAGAEPRPPCRCRTTLEGDHRYGYLEGTSMATAMVSGAAALVRGLNPDLDAEAVVRLLKEQASRPPGVGWTPDLGWGILDAGAAVRMASETDRRPPVSRVEPMPARADPGRVTVRWSGRDRAPRGVKRAGLRRYELWVSIDGGRAQRVLRTGGARTKDYRFILRAGHTYAFSTTAIDRAGNREDRPRRPDETVVVG